MYVFCLNYTADKLGAAPTGEGRDSRMTRRIREIRISDDQTESKISRTRRWPEGSEGPDWVEAYACRISVQKTDDQIMREIRMSGKAECWLQWDLGCRLLVCSAWNSRLRLLPPNYKPAHFPVRRFPGKLGHPRLRDGEGGEGRKGRVRGRPSFKISEQTNRKISGNCMRQMMHAFTVWPSPALKSRIRWNSTPPFFHAHANELRPVIFPFEPKGLDDASNRIPPLNDAIIFYITWYLL